jgi:COP9 signalosome complex subunit 8
MTGPPTPPPTTATEMADEARTSAAVVNEPSAVVPPPASPSQPKQVPQDTYQLLFPTLGNLAYHNDYKQLIDVAERNDLKVRYKYWRSRDIIVSHKLVLQGDSDRQFTRLLLVAPLTLAYLILDDLYVLQVDERPFQQLKCTKGLPLVMP